LLTSLAEISTKVTEGEPGEGYFLCLPCSTVRSQTPTRPNCSCILVWDHLRVTIAPAPRVTTAPAPMEERYLEKDKIPWMSSVEEDETDESSGSATKTIIIVLVIIVVVVVTAVTGYAYQKKILCFEQSSDDDEEEATGESPLLKETTSASKVSPSRTTSATTLDSRPSGTSVSRSTTYGHR